MIASHEPPVLGEFGVKPDVPADAAAGALSPYPVPGSRIQDPDRRPQRRRTSMKHSRTMLGGLAVALAAYLALVASAPTAPRAPSAQAERVDLATGLPAFAPGYRLSLTRAVIPPGAAFPPHRHPGMQVAVIEAGTLRFTVFRGSVKVFRGPADGSQRLVRTITPGHPGSIAPGEWIVETPGLRHQGANTGGARVVILLATLLRADEPAAIPISP
jgi:mannose-6-phosphate isomerase-like protein (cupin superfamily)